MAVQFKDGVVIGADSRTTTGSYIVRSSFNWYNIPDLTLSIRNSVGQSSDR
jgi:hypothetical protein